MRLALTTMTDTTAAEDAADDGGGATFNNGGTISATETVFDANDASRAGGGIESTGGDLTLTRNLYLNNATGNPPGNGGSVHASGTSTLSSTDETYRANTATNEGGGLWTAPTWTPRWMAAPSWTTLPTLSAACSRTKAGQWM